jgi:hypothetical protein
MRRIDTTLLWRSGKIATLMRTVRRTTYKP